MSKDIYRRLNPRLNFFLEFLIPKYAIGICDVMEAVVGQRKITKNSKLKTKNHNSSFENGEGRMKHEGFLFTGIFFFLNKKFLHSPCSILHA